MTAMASEEMILSPPLRGEIRSGERLRVAREGHGLNLTEVAASLRLRVDTVQAMEEGNWDLLPGKAFVLGYLRSYCKLLDLPPDSLQMQVLEEWQPAAPALILHTNPRQINSSHWAIRSVTYLLIVLLGILMVIAWQGNTSFFASNTVAKALVEQEGKVSAKSVASLLTEPEKNNFKARESLKVIPQDLNSISAVLPEQKPRLQLAEEASIGELPKAAFPKGGGINSEKNLAEQEKAAQDHDVSISEQLLLHLNGNSWVDISDSTGKQLVYKLLKAGTTLELSGVAPFHIIVGNALAAKMEFNGQPLDLTSHTKGNVARLTISSPNNS
jgi:cytoskeleton protein RodZ